MRHRNTNSYMELGVASRVCIIMAIGISNDGHLPNMESIVLEFVSQWYSILGNNIACSFATFGGSLAPGFDLPSLKKSDFIKVSLEQL